MLTYRIHFLERVSDFIGALVNKDKAKVLARIAMMKTHFDSVETKMLKAPIKELKVSNYRLIFFIEGSDIYFIHGFVKKTQKTPKQEITYAEKVYKELTKTI